LSIADIANTNGSDRESVIEAIVQAETDLINQKVATGLIKQEGATEWLAGLSDFVAEFVEMGFVDDVESDEDAAPSSDGSAGEENRNPDDPEAASDSTELTITQAANMALVLHKNARTKTPATFPDHHIYLPILMK